MPLYTDWYRLYTFYTTQYWGNILQCNANDLKLTSSVPGLYWPMCLCLFYCNSLSIIPYLALVTGDGVAASGSVLMSLWSLCYGIRRRRSWWGVCHLHPLNSSFSSCLSLNAAVFFRCQDKQHIDGNLLQLSQVMNSVKSWFTSKWQSWENLGKNSLIYKMWANGAATACCSCGK